MYRYKLKDLKINSLTFMIILTKKNSSAAIPKKLFPIYYLYFRKFIESSKSQIDTTTSLL